MKHKYIRKDKKHVKPKDKNKKMSNKAPVTLDFEASATEPIEPGALVDLAADVLPGDATEAA